MLCVVREKSICTYRSSTRERANERALYFGLNDAVANVVQVWPYNRLETAESAGIETSVQVHEQLLSVEAAELADARHVFEKIAVDAR